MSSDNKDTEAELAAKLERAHNDGSNYALISMFTFVSRES